MHGVPGLKVLGLARKLQGAYSNRIKNGSPKTL